eukprot:superscaffoldBa00010036_g24466
MFAHVKAGWQSGRKRATFLQAVKDHLSLQMETLRPLLNLDMSIMKELNTDVSDTTSWRASLTKPATMVNGLERRNAS